MCFRHTFLDGMLKSFVVILVYVIDKTNIFFAFYNMLEELFVYTNWLLLI
ncbi:hypothetical protein L21SP5_01896 [Salinivirga cyanobacteriivorans]|uniref:Uncharacterized protein n=1 Tax=Salinivirga cyanobacteriivorans TaxID=1307839 RepID=A0A0S2HZP3_9BACT|nr:hypothetical protein L21SP5_01896 [Salinivirga cyanobacteriivorans]